MDGLSVARRDVPDCLLTPEISRRLVTRHPGAEPELQFLLRERSPLVPAVVDGQLQTVSWGSSSKTSQLPRVSDCWIEHLEAGRWAWMKPVPIEIPACFGLERGIWYQITQGVKGVLVRDERGQPHAYILTQPATHYYQIMTRHERMPVLIGQTM